MFSIICVNPEHLFVGTQPDNIQDMIQKERKASQQGELHSNVKLTEQDVLEILASQETQSVLAKRYNVNQSVISRIQTRKAWTHL